MQEGFKRLEEAGTVRVMVLKDPAYYQRFGFKADASIVPPYPLPKEYDGARQSTMLQKSAQPLQGDLTMPAPWLQEYFWRP